MPVPVFLALRKLLLFSLLLLAVAACRSSRPAGGGRGAVESGLGSYYADKFVGRPTASGVPYRPEQLTAAHNTLPFGTRIVVTNVRNGRSVEVEVNDRGPHGKNRIVDLSKRAARQIGLLEAGLAPVTVRVVRLGPGR